MGPFFPKSGAVYLKKHENFSKRKKRSAEQELSFGVCITSNDSSFLFREELEGRLHADRESIRKRKIIN